MFVIRLNNREYLQKFYTWLNKDKNAQYVLRPDFTSGGYTITDSFLSPEIFYSEAEAREVFKYCRNRFNGGESWQPEICTVELKPIIVQKFKAGDRVRVVNISRDFSSILTNADIIGKIYTIQRPSYEGAWKVIEGGHIFLDHEIEKVN
jgi:hypothetical protein